ncbi:MAG: cytochrome c [Candidatus Obscuribacterales bacterium]|nr:cytochrome c [Candidatus Obscuribacterales bacterium]
MISKESIGFALACAFMVLFLMACWPDKTRAQSTTSGSNSAYKSAPVSPLSKKGLEYFEKNQCSMCHMSGGKGGCLAPPFDGIGGRRSLDFLISRISDSEDSIEKFAEKYGKYELMPHVRVSDYQARALAAYLLTLPEPKSGFKVIGHNDPANSVDSDTLKTKQKLAETQETIGRGKKLLFQKGCLACHSIGGVGGSFAPPLDGVGKRRSKESIAGHMLRAELLSAGDDYEYGSRGTIMPPLGLSGDEIEAVAAYLQTLK